MSQITVKNASGKDTGKVDLDENTFGIEPNVSVMHQVVTAQLAARRAGTQSTKTRSEVRGGGAKPFRQKGTGNARQGSIRAPHYSGGGVALGPKPRKYDQKTPKKMIGLALRSALSDRANEGKIIVVDSWGWDAPSTKAAKAALADLGITGKALVVVDRDDAAAALSFRNLIEVQLITPGELNAYDVLCNEYIIFTQGTLPAGASEPKGKAPKATEPEAKATKAPKAKEAPAKESSAKAPKAAEADAADSAAPAIQSFADVDGSGAPASAIHPHGSGSHAALADNAQPAGFPIKGNADSMLYHVPGSSFYGRTVAEVWFDGEASAQAAGFSRPDSQADADAPTADEIAEASADAVPVQPHGAGSYVALAGDAEPDGYPIKGNADSMLYHTTESSFYGRTVAEVWFADEAAAEAAGFSKPASQQAAEESDEG